MFYFAKMIAQGDEYSQEDKLNYLHELSWSELEKLHEILLNDEELKNTQKGKEALRMVETIRG